MEEEEEEASALEVPGGKPIGDMALVGGLGVFGFGLLHPLHRFHGGDRVEGEEEEEEEEVSLPNHIAIEGT